MNPAPQHTCPEIRLIADDITTSASSVPSLYHGTYSANPPYTVLDVIGTAITARLKAELAQFGFNEFQETPRGFCAVRPIPTDVAS